MKVLLVFCFLVFELFALDLNFENFSSSFEQNIHSKDSTINYKGYFILSKDKAFWSYESPSKKEIYINKNEIIIVEHDLEQVIFSKLEKIPNLNEIFKNAKKVSPNELIAQYEGIHYKIELREEKLKSISYKDEFDNSITINFFNQKKNQQINENLFVAKIPPNYDKVR